MTPTLQISMKSVLPHEVGPEIKVLSLAKRSATYCERGTSGTADSGGSGSNDTDWISTGRGMFCWYHAAASARCHHRNIRRKASVDCRIRKLMITGDEGAAVHQRNTATATTSAVTIPSNT